MKTRNTMLVAISCLAAAVAAFGQGKGVAGSWGTDAAIAHLANAAAPAAGGQSVMFILKVDDSKKVTGSIVEFGNALCGKPDTNLPIDSGTVEGNVVTFQTTRPSCPAAAASINGTFTATGVGNNFVSVQGPPAGGGGQRGGGGGPAIVIWTGTLGADDTLSVTRAIQGGRGGGGGGRGGPGAGAPPANNFVQGQGGGGGRGGGGRGGGGGALIMHRIP